MTTCSAKRVHRGDAGGWLIKTPNKFQVVNGVPSYHILLGRQWLHLHQCVPSTWHQCVKSRFRGRDIEIPATKALFDASEAHSIDASMFDELAPPGVNVMHPSERVQLGTKREKGRVELEMIVHPTQAFKRPKEEEEGPRL